MNIEPHDTFNNATESTCTISNTETDIPSCSLSEMVRNYENEIIKKALKKTGGNISKTAKMLGIPRQTLQYKIDKINCKK